MPRIVVLLSSMAAMLMLVGGVAYAAFPGVNGKILYTDIESYDPGGESTDRATHTRSTLTGLAKSSSRIFHGQGAQEGIFLPMVARSFSRLQIKE
jgi:hypothetical protein